MLILDNDNTGHSNTLGQEHLGMLAYVYYSWEVLKYFWSLIDDLSEYPEITSYIADHDILCMAKYIDLYNSELFLYRALIDWNTKLGLVI